MWMLDVTNMAGIRSGRATLEPGTNVVQASNWQGKSSLLASIETVMGTKAALTDGADRGEVALDAGDDEITTELVRDGERVTRRGDVYLSDEQDRVCAELFAFLGEDNPIRTAVRQGENLEDVLTRPLDLENIDEQIAEHRRERDRVESELREAERANERLPELQERVTSIESDVEDLREERAALASEASESEERSEVRDALSDRRAQRDQLQSRVDQLDARIESTTEQLEEKREILDDVEVPEEDDYCERIETARAELEDLERQLDVLTDVYNANRRVLEENCADLVTDVERGVTGDEVACWLCGETSDQAAVERRLEALDEQAQDLRRRANERREEVADLEAEQRERDRTRQRVSDVETEIADLRSRLDDYQVERESSRDRLADLEAEIDDLETELATLESEADDTGAELTDVESQIKYRESELEDARAELAETEDVAANVATLEEQRADLSDRIEELRSRKDHVKQNAREAFDDAMREVLPVFEPGFEHARLTPQFDLVVVRDGREVGLDVLSEGEVELLGFLAATAGYEAFDVADRVPVVLLDELGSLASEHLHHLVDYVRGKPDYVVTTAYPEAGEFDGHVVTPDDWTVVSDDVEAAL